MILSIVLSEAIMMPCSSMRRRNGPFPQDLWGDQGELIQLFVAIINYRLWVKAENNEQIIINPRQKHIIQADKNIKHINLA